MTTVSLQGPTLHRGVTSTVTLRRRAAGDGLHLRRVDGTPTPAVPVTPDAVRETDRRMVLAVGGRTVETTEHLFAALAGLGLWDVQVDVDGPEIPILDGSARPWVQAVSDWPRAAPTPPLIVEAPLSLRRGDSRVTVEPAHALEIICEVHFDHPAVGHQSATWDGSAATFRGEIAPARTFGFTGELEALRARGLIAGGSLDCALVFDAEGPLVPPRFPNEPARHKLLDAMGDLALLGRPLRAKVTLHRSGHALMSDLLHALAQLHPVPSPASSGKH